METLGSPIVMVIKTSSFGWMIEEESSNQEESQTWKVVFALVYQEVMQAHLLTFK